MIRNDPGDPRCQELLFDFTRRIRNCLDKFPFGQMISLETEHEGGLGIRFHSLRVLGRIRAGPADFARGLTVSDSMTEEVYQEEPDRIAEGLATRIIYNCAFAQTEADRKGV